MRCVIAGCSFDLSQGEVQRVMAGVEPEPVTGESVLIGDRSYPIKQVGEALTSQDRRDFSSSQVTRAMIALGFACSRAEHRR